MPTLAVDRSSAFSHQYDVTEEANFLVTLDASSESNSMLKFEGREYQMTRESCMGDFILSGPEGELCRATKPSALFRTFAITYQKETFSLEANSAFGDSFKLKRADEVVGKIDAKGFFSTQGKVDFPGALPMPVQFFLIWLALLMWARSEDAATTNTNPVG